MANRLFFINALPRFSEVRSFLSETAGRDSILSTEGKTKRLRPEKRRSLFDTGRTFSGFLNAVAIAFHHLIFDSFPLNGNVNNITRVVHLQMGAILPVGTVRAMLRIDSFHPIRMFKCHMVSLMSLLSACFFTALLTQTLWRRLFITV